MQSVSMNKVSFNNFLLEVVDCPPTSKQQESTLRILDTIFFENSSTVPSWFFTTKFGQISRKKIEKFKAENVISRFSKFALANSNNNNKFVATIFDSVGRKLANLTEMELSKMLTSNLEVFYEKETVLQVFILPSKGINKTFRCLLTKNENNSEDFDAIFSVKLNVEKTFLDILDVQNHENSIAFEQLLNTVKSLVAMYNKNKHASSSRRVESFVVEFFIDDNNEAWISQMLDFNLKKKITENVSESINENKIVLKINNQNIIDDENKNIEIQIKTIENKNIQNEIFLNVGEDALKNSTKKIEKTSKIYASTTTTTTTATINNTKIKKQKTENTSNNKTLKKKIRNSFFDTDKEPNFEMIAKFALEKEKFFFFTFL
jgi:hypothetical protein